MAKAKRASTKDEELEIRDENDYKDAYDEYDDKKKRVQLAADMIETIFWRQGFKIRREVFDKTRKKLTEVIKEKPPEDYESSEEMKALNKAKLNLTKAMIDMDNFVVDVQLAVDVLRIFCEREDLPLFKDIELMTASFSRKTGTITMKVA